MEGKITLEFNAPEQEYDAKVAMDGHKWYCVYLDILAKIRERDKYTDLESFTIDEIRTIVIEARENNNLPHEY